MDVLRWEERNRRLLEAHRLHRLGCEIDLKHFPSPFRIEVFQHDGTRMLRYGPGYRLCDVAVRLRVTALEYSSEIIECELALSSMIKVDWLQSPWRPDAHRLPSGESFARHAVLNEFLEGQGQLRKGRRKEGYLLGQAVGDITSLGSEVSAVLWLTDINGLHFPSLPFALPVRRSERVMRPPDIIRGRRRLFEKEGVSTTQNGFVESVLAPAEAIPSTGETSSRT